MSTATAPNSRQQATQTKEPPRSSDFDEFMKRSVKFTPLAESEQIEVSVGMVKNVLAVRSKSGKEPQPADIMKFMMLCKSRQLNPFVGDAYLLGYDSKDGTKWNLITAIQALRKRAEANPKYRGTECGVIVRGADNARIEREGAMIDDGEKLIGGWAKVYRDDRSIPTYASVKFSVYDTGYSRWQKDPGGMIVKVAEAASLRQAFPSDLAGLYIRDEFSGDSEPLDTTVPKVSGIAGLKSQLKDPTITAPPYVEPERDTEEIKRQDAMDVDQRDDGSTGASAIDPYAGDASAPSPEEIAEQEAAAKGKPKGKQKSAFDSAPNVGQ